MNKEKLYTVLIFLLLLPYFTFCQRSFPRSGWNTPLCPIRVKSEFQTELPWDGSIFKTNYFIWEKLQSGEGTIITPPTEDNQTWTYKNLKPNEREFRYYFILEGDYRKLGLLDLSGFEPNHSEEESKQKIFIAIKKINPFLSVSESFVPWIPRYNTINSFDEKDGKVLIQGIRIYRNSNWIISGLTLTPDSYEEGIEQTGLVISTCANNNVVNNCVFENFTQQHIRIINSSNNTIQNCLEYVWM